MPRVPIVIVKGEGVCLFTYHFPSLEYKSLSHFIGRLGYHQLYMHSQDSLLQRELQKDYLHVECPYVKMEFNFSLTSHG